MSAALRGMGFEVIEGRDVTLRGLELLVDQFTVRLHSGDLGLFYYAGHGAQVQLDNYMIPVDFHAASESDVKYTAYSATRVCEKMEESGARLRILILDACRNNPFRSKRDASRGLAPMNSDAEGTPIAFATGDNNVADDNPADRNGLFTKYLVKAFETPGLSHDEIFRKVKSDVFLASGKKQNPYTYENVVGRFYFTLNVSVNVAPPASAPNRDPSAAQLEYEYWLSVKDSRTARLFEAYLARYPNGQFADIAKAKVEEMRPAPPPPPVVKTLEAIKVNGKDGLRHVWIPPGHFNMGCSPNDGECRENEKPAHEVTISRGFWMGQTAVTVGAWKRYAQATGKEMPPEPKFFDRALNAGWANELQPIVNVTWDDARSFCSWAGLRLPTEAEYEYAARAGSQGARYGSLDDVAWFADNSGKERIDSAAIWKDDQKNYGKRLNENGNGPKPVGLKSPNGYKLYDILGNVWAWTADWYGDKYYSSTEERDPMGPPGGEYRVLRGGSWLYRPISVRASDRDGLRPGLRSNGIGCRCAGEIP